MGSAKLLRAEVPVALLEDNEDNPNEMSDREWDLLIDNMKQRGFTDPIYCAPVDHADFLGRLSKATDKAALWAGMEADGKRFRIVGGHHRKKAAIFLQMEHVPCTIDLDPEFDREQQEIQMIRHNVIHGQMKPDKFFALYKKHEAKHGAEMMAQVFGFADQAYMDKLIAQTVKSLPDHMKQKFKEAAEEIKTVDDLAKLLNYMFTNFGDTLKHGWMCVDYGGQKSIWLRISKKTYDATLVLGDVCVKEGRTMDDIFGRLVQMLAKGELADVWEDALLQTKKIAIPEGFAALPTAENLKKAGVDAGAA